MRPFIAVVAAVVLFARAIEHGIEKGIVRATHLP